MLTSVANYNKNNKVRIESVLCPGMGTTTGRMSPKEVARQMSKVYKNFLNPTTNMNWENLNKHHQEIIG